MNASHTYRISEKKRRTTEEKRVSLLVLLSLGQPLKALRTAEDFDGNEANSNLKTVTRLLRDLEAASGHFYCDVVEQCLCWRCKGDNDLDDEAVQDKIYQRISFPLAESLKVFCFKGYQLM